MILFHFFAAATILLVYLLLVHAVNEQRLFMRDLQKLPVKTET